MKRSTQTPDYIINQETFRFMADLNENNNKTWFTDNRSRYDQFVRLPLKTLGDSLTDPMVAILPEFDGKVKMSRINNDLRFHPDKPPYKEHMWISFADRNRKEFDLFAAVGKEGWVVGSSVSGPKREHHDNWRNNLLRFPDLWRAWFRLSGLEKNSKIYAENPYKRALFPDIPADLYDLVQSRAAWIVSVPRMEFDSSPADDILTAICLFVPVYLFMSLTSADILLRLSELGDPIPAPNEQVYTAWEELRKLAFEHS